MRVLDESNYVSVLEPADYEAGIDGDSFKLIAAAAGIFMQFGAVTGDAVLSVYCGATVGAKTTLVPFRYRLSSGDFKAASCDLFGAETLDADGQITLTAATYDHRVLAIHLDAAEIPETKPWITIELSAAASVLLCAAHAITMQPRFRPNLTITA